MALSAETGNVNPWQIRFSTGLRSSFFDMVEHAAVALPLSRRANPPLPLCFASRCTMQSEDVPIPEPGAPECTVGLNAAGEQLLPVAPRLETDPTPRRRRIGQHPPCEAASALNNVNCAMRGRRRCSWCRNGHACPADDFEGASTCWSPAIQWEEGEEGGKPQRRLR